MTGGFGSLFRTPSSSTGNLRKCPGGGISKLNRNGVTITFPERDLCTAKRLGTIKGVRKRGGQLVKRGNVSASDGLLLG